MRLKQNPTLLKAIHLGNEQIINRKHVMISYSWNAQKDIVVKIAEAIAEAGIEVWRDEDRLKPGTNLQRAMLEAVEGAVVVIVFYSPDYYRSRNCQFEYNQAQELKRTIFPIVVDIIEKKEENEYKEYDSWLKKELHENGIERIYTKTSDVESSEDKLKSVVDGVRALRDEETKKMQSNSDDPNEWNRSQVDAWLDKKNLHDLLVEYLIHYKLPHNLILLNRGFNS